MMILNIKSLEKAYYSKKLHLKGLKMVNKKNCKHPGEPIIGYMMLKGIERKTMRCSICGELLDYIPQYDED